MLQTDMILDKPRQKAYEVCLVQMPYGSIEQPHLGLSILKAALGKADIAATVYYANFMWAEDIGVHAYKYIHNKERYYNLLGEWTFAEAAFPEFTPNHEDYFQHIQFSLQRLEQYLKPLNYQQNVRELVWELRQKAKIFVNQLAQQIIELQPCIVGCSSMHQQHCASLALLKQIKQLNPNIVTVMGGANCETSMGIVTHKQCHWIDFIVSGEADNIFPPLCQDILLNGPDLSVEALPKGILGPVHRQNNGKGYKPFENGLFRAKVDNLNDIPIPDYEDYFTLLQHSAIGDMVIPALPIETSRGCWWGEVNQCIFCGISGEERGFRSKAPDRVIQEFAHLSEQYHIKSFMVVDRILDMHYFKNVIPTLVEQNQHYNILYETKANLKREQVHKLAKAGIKWIQPGIETLDNTLLNILDKGTTVHQNVQLMKWAREAGLFNYWFLLYDIPGETDDIYLKMVEWLPKISHLQPPAYMNMFDYHRYSPVYKQPAQFGLKISPDRSYSYIYPWDKQTLAYFAYYFSETTKQRYPIDIHDTVEIQRPGLRALRDHLRTWQHEWDMESVADAHAKNPVAPATLTMIDDGEQIDITDTRACAIQSQFYLKGLSRQIYHICEQAHKAEAILTELHATSQSNCTQARLESTLQELCESGLLLNFKGYFLSLAVQGPLKPIPRVTDSPAGYIESIAYTKIKKQLGLSASHLKKLQALFSGSEE